MSLRGSLEAGAFGLLALALHAAAFVALPNSGGAVAAGAGGEELIALEAAAPGYLELVARFDAPPLPQLPQLTPFAPPKIELPPLPGPDLVALPPPVFDPAVPPAPKAPPAPQIRPEPTPAEPPPKQAQAPRPKPAKAGAASPARAAQHAAGSGGGAQAGLAGAARAASLAPAREGDLRAQWGAQIRAGIERRKTYPAAAGRASGSVKVQIAVTRTGALSGVSVLHSSGNAALDGAAVQAVRRAGKFPAAPKGLEKPSYSFALTIRFSR